MNGKFQQILALAEQERLELLKEVSKLPAERLFYRRGTKWSISQILIHLLTAEKLSLQYMKKKSLGIDSADNAGWWEAAKYFMLKISQRLPLRYKAPPYLSENMPEAFSFHDLSDQWDQHRKELIQFLHSIDEKNINKKIYKHPVAGRLSASQAVSFFRDHIKHHLPQIKRLL